MQFQFIVPKKVLILTISLIDLQCIDQYDSRYQLGRKRVEYVPIVHFVKHLSNLAHSQMGSPSLQNRPATSQCGFLVASSRVFKMAAEWSKKISFESIFVSYLSVLPLFIGFQMQGFHFSQSYVDTKDVFATSDHIWLSWTTYGAEIFQLIS